MGCTELEDLGATLPKEGCLSFWVCEASAVFVALIESRHGRFLAAGICVPSALCSRVLGDNEESMGTSCCGAT